MFIRILEESLFPRVIIHVIVIKESLHRRRNEEKNILR
jgi:hypothetical protein